MTEPVESEVEVYVQVLKDIYSHLDNVEYECSGRVYELTDDEMSWIFYCRDMAWLALKKFNRN